MRQRSWGAIEYVVSLWRASLQVNASQNVGCCPFFVGGRRRERALPTGTWNREGGWLLGRRRELHGLGRSWERHQRSSTQHERKRTGQVLPARLWGPWTIAHASRLLIALTK